MALAKHTVGDYGTETDFYGAYAAGAKLIEHGHLDPSRYGVVGPIYEIVLGFAGFLVRDLFSAAELISVVATTAALALWATLLRRRIDERLALIATLFIATNPHFLRYGYNASPDTLGLALQAASRGSARRRWCAHRARGRVRCGCGVSDRYSAIALLPVGVLAALWGGRRPAASAPADAQSRMHARRAEALAFAGGFLAPVAAWMLDSIASGGHLAFQLHHNVAYEVFARARGISWDDYERTLQPQFHSFWDVIRRDPAAVAMRVLTNVPRHLFLDARGLLGWPVAIAAALGPYFAWRAGDSYASGRCGRRGERCSWCSCRCSTPSATHCRSCRCTPRSPPPRSRPPRSRSRSGRRGACGSSPHSRSC